MMVYYTGWDGHGGDDLSKFLWFVRIAASEFSDIGENDYTN